MSDETEQIKERLNVADVVGEYVTLKNAGQNLKGLCPFHQEKTPSFIVSPHRNTWHCFGCSSGGDVFSFIQKIEGLDFPGALKILADKAGVQLKTTNYQTTSHRQRLFDALAQAGKLYHEILMRQSAGKKAKDYLVKRGVTEKTMELFQIGYAPDSWDMTQKWLQKKGFTETEMIASGTIGRSQRGSLFDRFRGRIMFPITDTQGRIVAFGGRIVPWHETGNEGKYVNSPEGPLYEKRRVIYNMARAKHALRSQQPCIVVEGYMDVVMLVQAGIANVVAASGTAFTADHIKQLQRFTNTLHFAFDADAAGFKATVSATGAALMAGMKVATIVLPAGKDPADIVLGKKPEEVQEIMGKTQSLMNVLIEQLKSSDANSQEIQLESLLPLIRLVRNPIQQGEMVQDIAHTLHVPEGRIVDILASAQAPTPLLASIEPVSTAPVISASSPAAMSEHQLLGMLMVYPDIRQELYPQLSPELFLDYSAQMVYNSLQRMSAREELFFSLSTHDLISAFDEQLIPSAEGMRTRAEELLTTSSNTPQEEARLLLRSLKRRSLKGKLLSTQEQLAQGGQAERLEVLKTFQSIAEELNRIDT